MKEEERIFKGILFAPSDPELVKTKLHAHKLSHAYSNTDEDETKKRADILAKLLSSLGENSRIQGPLFVHYGTHTTIGKNFFGNYNLTIQDDATVTIGDHVNFGPNVTIVTPIHPMLASERRQMLDKDGKPILLCYAKPVHIGNDVWLCANVTVTGGVTIGDGCVIGAGSVVTTDIPPNTFAAGVPCRVIRPITKEDSMVNLPEILADCRPMGDWPKITDNRA